MLTSAFRGFGGEELVKEFLGSIPGGFWAQFMVVMAVIFFSWILPRFYRNLCSCSTTCSANITS